MRGRVHQDPGVLVWRDPWDPSGWEVTESFVRAWGWAVVGCWDLFHSTNKWRELRGEKPLFRIPSVRDCYNTAAFSTETNAKVYKKQL